LATKFSFGDPFKDPRAQDFDGMTVTDFLQRKWWMKNSGALEMIDVALKTTFGKLEF